MTSPSHTAVGLLAFRGNYPHGLEGRVALSTRHAGILREIAFAKSISKLASA